MLRIPSCKSSVCRCPCAWWFVWLALAKGIPSLLGIQTSVSSPETLYASWTLHLWGIQLVVGALVAGTGLALCHDVLQRCGFGMLGVATVYDLVAIFYYYGLTRPAYTLLYVGFAAACILRTLPLEKKDANVISERHER